MFERVIVIGDVHGCLNELQELISQLKLQHGDRVFFIGDLIDRGPDTVGVIKYVRKLAEIFPTILIIGNHEEKFLRYLHNKTSNIQVAAAMAGQAIYDRYLELLDTSDISFLSDSFINFQIPEQNICLLHGGLPENVSINMEISNPYSHDFLRKMKNAHLILKTRYLDTKGKFVGLDQENESSRFWAEKYDGRFGRILFGHHAVLSEKPVFYPHAINLDTGCVYGGWLSACIIENGQVSFSSVKAKKEYTKMMIK